MPSIRRSTVNRHSSAGDWDKLNREIAVCRSCPRLIQHCQTIGDAKRKSYRDQEYWARPVPNFGVAPAAILLVGLAPGAHGANRTGRMFTGDQSGLWLFRSLHRAGLATQACSDNRDDGMQLVDCAITAVCHCAPPGNRPMIDEIANCRGWLEETIRIVNPAVFLALGQIGWNAVIQYAQGENWLNGPRPAFGHGRYLKLTNSITLLGSYHPSQQNTFTGRLTEAMLDEIMAQAKALASRCKN